MANVNKAAAKAYFNTGDVPTETQFANLIDSIPFYEIITKVAHGFSKMMCVYPNSSGVWTRADASTLATARGFVIISVPDSDKFVVGKPGDLVDITGLGLTAGTTYYLDINNSGINYTAAKPEGIGEAERPLFFAYTTTQAEILGYEPMEIAAAPSGSGSGGTEIISWTTSTAIANLDLNMTTYHMDYDKIVIEIEHMKPVTATNFKILISTDGTTFPVTDYAYHKWQGNTGTVSGSGVGFIEVSDYLSNVAGQELSGIITIKRPGVSNKYPVITWDMEGWYDVTSNSPNKYTGYGTRKINQFVAGIRLFMQSGNIDSIKYRVTGYN